MAKKIAAYKKFSYGFDGYNYEQEACDFMTKIGPEKVIGMTSKDSSTECSVIVWYWKDET